MPATSCFRVSDDLDAYLKRVGFIGEPFPNLATLRQLHRRHVEAIAYENLDVQLGRPVSRSPSAAFRKIVLQGRGGWCFEMNGLFGFMLEAVGFRVQRLAGAVMREQMGDSMVGNHLALIVDLDRPYLADVGLGNGLAEPVPLVEGRFTQGFRQFALERKEGGWWRFRNHDEAVPPSFDFSLAVTDERLLDAQSLALQTNPASPFVQHAIVQRQLCGRVESLVGTTHSMMSAAGTTSVEVANFDHYARLLRDTFGLEIAEAATLWAKVSKDRDADFLAGMRTERLPIAA